MKWSDGDGFDTEDIRFWFEDVVLNDEITPSKPGWLRTKGGFADVEIIDELTFRFRFKDAYPLIMNRLGHYNGGSIPLPSQYLKEYHITYNKEANALAKKEGFDNWVQLYAKKATIYQGSIRTNHEGVLSAKDTEEVTPPASDFASLSGRSAWPAQQDFFAVRNVVYQGVTFKGGDILFAADTHGVIPPNDFELMSDRDAWLPQAVGAGQLKMIRKGPKEMEDYLYNEQAIREQSERLCDVPTTRKSIEKEAVK